MAERPTLTVSAAVEAFQVERRTLQRLLAAGELDGAQKDTRGRWLIPVEALHASGFAARQTWLSNTTVHDNDATHVRQALSSRGEDGTTRSASEGDSDATELRHRIARLEAQIEAERQLREAAERNAEDLRTAMRMIEAGAGPSLTQPLPKAKRKWWQRN